MNKNPFYEFFKGYIPKLIMIIFILICVNNIIPFVCDMRDYFWNNREGLIFINRTSDICYMGVFLLTLIFTNNFLPQMLNIRGDRDACIKSFFKMMIIVIIWGINAMKYKNIVKNSSKFLIFCFLLEMENGKSYIIAVPILEDTWRNKYD